MLSFPALPPGVTVAAAALTVTLSDGSTRTVEVPAEFGAERIIAELNHRGDVLSAGFAVRWSPRGDGEPPRHFYRLTSTDTPTTVTRG